MIAQRNHSVFSRRPSVNPEFRLRPPPRAVMAPHPAAPAPRRPRALRPPSQPATALCPGPPQPAALTLQSSPISHARVAPMPAGCAENTIAPFPCGGLPWIHDDTPGTEATRVHESGAAAFGCPDRRSGRRVSANRHLQAAAPGKSPHGAVSFTSRRTDRPESLSYRLDN